MSELGIKPEQFLEKIKKLEQQNKIMREALRDISGYETCWKCEFYLGLNSKYCNPPKLCSIKTRDQFKPIETTKIKAKQALEKCKELEK